MRNTWYPRQDAEYLSTLRNVKPRDVVAERDFTFGMQAAEEEPASGPKKEDNAIALPRTKLLPVSLAIGYHQDTVLISM